MHGRNPQIIGPIILDRFNQNSLNSFNAVFINVLLLLDHVVKVSAEFLLYLSDGCRFSVRFVEKVLRIVRSGSIWKLQCKERIRAVGEHFQFVRLGQGADRVSRNLTNLYVVPKLRPLIEAQQFHLTAGFQTRRLKHVMKAGDHQFMMKVEQTALHLDHLFSHCDLAVLFLTITPDDRAIEFVCIASCVDEKSQRSCIVEVVVKLGRIVARRESKAIYKTLMV